MSDAGHSPPSNTEVTNEWSYTSYLPLRLDLVDRQNFTFSFTFIPPHIVVAWCLGVGRICVNTRDNAVQRTYQKESDIQRTVHRYIFL